MSSAILYAEVCIVCILFLLMIATKVKDSTFIQSQRHDFLLVCIANMLLFALDAVWILVENDEVITSTAGNWLLNMGYYILGALVGYLWFCYSESIQEPMLASSRRWRIITFLPVLALVALTVSSYWTHLLFFVDATNHYHRGPAYSIQLVIAYGYVIFTAIKAFVLSSRTDDFRRRTELRALASYIVPGIVAGVLQIAFPRYPILCVGNTLGIFYVHLTLQEQLVSIDALTGLNNRNQLFQYLSVKFRHEQDDRPLYLLMIDVNKFKSINDTYGHTEGDHALKLVADALMRSCNQRGFFIARYGGDEFTVICELDEGQDVMDVHARIHEAMGEVETPYPLTVSVGSAQYTRNIKTRQDLISRADAELYKAKAALARQV